MVLLPFALLAAFQGPPADEAVARIEQALRATRIDFTRTPNKVQFFHDYKRSDGRFARVYIVASPAPVAKFRYHAISTEVWFSKEAPSRELIDEVFTVPRKFGTYYLHLDTNGYWSIRFGVQFDATQLSSDPSAADPGVQVLKSYLELAMTIGNEVGSAVYGKK